MKDSFLFGKIICQVMQSGKYDPKGLGKNSSKRKSGKLAVVVQPENIRGVYRCLYLYVSEEEKKSGHIRESGEQGLERWSVTEGYLRKS